MSKMNVFISQPMNGKKNEEIEYEREQFVEDLKKYLGEDINILDTIFHFAEDVPSLVYLGRSLEVLAKSDLAVFMDGWENARGCKIEHQAAKDYDIPTLELNGAWYPCT
nr:MAG TPA: N-deoxyribosyltransferase [Caudoviricetes sp.]